jgi:hypothetical protein
MRWVFIVARGSSIESVKIFDDYFYGETHCNEFLRISFGVENNFPEYRKGEFYNSEDGEVSVGLYKNSCQQATSLVQC